MAENMVKMEALKSFVRKESAKYLKQENITSIGIGYKITGGKKTDELSIQFTVGKKVQPEQLEIINATIVPPFFIIDNVKVPTDVIQRKFDASAREVNVSVKCEAASVRKEVADPLAPGVSIGHPSISAGTAGGIVYDAQSGTPYILSNWHVLSGPKGNIGDAIVQPGKYDDNRADKNVIGKLVRSYLGVAGDCAISSIENRKFDTNIIGLNVTINSIGEPDLGDRVVKSGRTTDVTYGIVNRIHVTTRIDYETMGDKEIGCFEIAPDPEFPALNGQISQGGDSGAFWVYVEGKKTSSMMVGLHFAGEVGDEPDHALACYAGSVFEKLGIRPVVPSETEQIEKIAQGYSPLFIGATIPLPIPADQEIKDDYVVVKGSPVIDYTHFSLAMSRSHRFARWVAWNIDGDAIRKLTRTGISFKKDPKVPPTSQVGNELYENNKLDRGHIARRADLIWGTKTEADKANTDSFYYTNITPQHEAFNQSEAHGIWGELENAIFADVDVENLRVSVMGGPIFSPSDPVYRNIALPKQFWKVLFYRESGEETVHAKGFVLTQEDLLNNLEALELPEFSVYEVPVQRIGELTGLILPNGEKTESVNRRRKIEAIEKGRVRRISSFDEIVG
jgi:endonuclease G, mitochondrial